MNLLLIFTVILCVLLMRYLPNILQFIKLIQFSGTIPGPTVAELIRNSKTEHILTWTKELHRKHGPFFRIWFGKDLTVFFTAPEDVKQILSSNTLLTKSRNHEFFESWLGKGLLTSSDDAWHRRRKLLTPAFHFRVLSEFKEPMEENCKILISKLREKANGEQFDIYPFIRLFALDVICETAMGIKKDAQLRSDSEYVLAAQNMCRNLQTQSFSFWLRFNVIFNMSAAAKTRKKLLKVLHGETNRVMQMRRQMLKNSQNSAVDANATMSDNIGGKRRLAFLDILLVSQMEGNGLTDTEIREEVDTFMFGGHDTTSSALSFAIYLLSQYSDVQQKAYEEAVQLEGNEKESMPYLEAVIKETLRLYPSVPFFSRKINADFQIGKVIVPRGAFISIAATLVHRDEQNFPQPETFNPERFLSEDKLLHPFAFVAFSAGPRNCIGQKFAMLELKVTLANILRNFKILPVNFTPSPVAELITKSSNGIQIRLKLRN